MLVGKMFVSCHQSLQSLRHTDHTGSGDAGEKYGHDELQTLNQDSEISRNLWSGTYPNNILGRLSVSDQNVNGIGCKLGVPPGLDIGVEHSVHVGASLFCRLPRWTGEPG